MSTSSHSRHSSDPAEVEIEIFVTQLDDVWVKIEAMEKKHKAEVMRLQARISTLEASLEQALIRLQKIRDKGDESPEIKVRTSRLWRELEGCRVKVFIGMADEAPAWNEKKQEVDAELKAPCETDREAPSQNVIEDTRYKTSDAKKS